MSEYCTIRIACHYEAWGFIFGSGPETIYDIELREYFNLTIDIESLVSQLIVQAKASNGLSDNVLLLASKPP